MAKGYKCPTCNKQICKYENGHYQCTDADCSAIWWGPFDKPSAGEKGKGYKCPQCKKQTVHYVASIGNVNVYRCSTCAVTWLEKGGAD